MARYKYVTIVKAKFLDGDGEERHLLMFGKVKKHTTYLEPYRIAEITPVKMIELPSPMTAEALDNYLIDAGRWIMEEFEKYVQRERDGRGQSGG